jgi:diaminopimelate epimerase
MMSALPHYVKSHGLGNVYIVVDPKDIPFALTPRRIRAICDLHTGIGSDGILLVSPPSGADFGVRIFNPDGSEAEKSGNGVRIFAKFLREHGYTANDRFTLDTAGGRVTCALEHEGDRVAYVTVDMGRATFDDLTSIEVDTRRIAVTSVSLGNPHCVVIVPDLQQVNVDLLGWKIEHHRAFPNKTNVQFAHVLSRSEVEIEIWERGAGHTLASGSSSCAVAAACHRLGLVDREVTVRMPGGRLEITVGEDYEMRMRGPVEEITAGDFSADLLRLLARG